MQILVNKWKDSQTDDYQERPKTYCSKFPNDSVCHAFSWQTKE
jgi:hypothetical protein